MLAGTLKAVMVASMVGLAIGSTPLVRTRTPPPPTAPHRTHRAPVRPVEEGCREIAAPALPVSAPPILTARTCS